MNSLLSKILILFFDTNTGTGTGVAGNVGPMGPEDDLKFLRENRGEVDDKEDSKDEDKEDKDEEDKDDIEPDENVEEEKDEEDKEDKEDKDEDEEEQEELVGGLVSAKDLKAKFPDIFKKVPELKAVIYREQQYSQLFADPNEAQEAANLANTFREMESDLVSGDFKPLLNGLKNTKEVDFSKLAASLLPSMKELDEPTFMKMISVPLKQVLRSAFRTGQQKDNKNLMYAAQHIHDFIFDDINLDEKAEFEGEAKKANPEEQKYKEKLEALDKRDHENFKKNVDLQFLGVIESEFLNGLDPNGEMSKWQKNKMFEDAVAEISRQLVADPRHMKNLEVLWRNAKASGYNSESKTRIVNTSLARARQIIPQIRTKLRQEAFAKDKKNGEEREPKKTFRTPERSSERREEKRKPNPRNTDDMSDLDIIRGAR